MYRIFKLIFIIILTGISSIAFTEERFTTYELAESGIIIKFPMSAKEIKREDAKIARREADQKARYKHPKEISPERFTTHELAESGTSIKFPMSAKEIKGEDAKIAQCEANQKIQSAISGILFSICPQS